MGPPNWGNDDSSLLGVLHEEETTQHNKKEQHIYRLTSPILIALQASAKQHSTLANPALYRDNIDVYSCATNITAKILAGSEEKPRKNTGWTHRTTQRLRISVPITIPLSWRAWVCSSWNQASQGTCSQSAGWWHWQRSNRPSRSLRCSCPGPTERGSLQRRRHLQNTKVAC